MDAISETNLTENLASPETDKIGYMMAWLQRRLPELKELALHFRLRAESLAAIVSSQLLVHLPPARALNARQAWQVLTILGCCGSSVERHAQQACVRRGEPPSPGTALGWMTVRREQQSFVQYFQQVADLVEHPYRDTFATFVEHNGPRTVALHPATGDVLYTLSPAFHDGAYVTFSNQPEERQFILLLKECAALQGAANLFLEILQDVKISLHDWAAINAAFHAATLLLAIRAKLQAFMATSEFSAEFFLDVLRQYACPWSQSNGLRPPSGANDASSLQGDIMLFTDLLPARAGFPGFRSHVKSTFSVLTRQAIRRIERSMRAPSIEARLLERIGRSSLSSCGMTPERAQGLLLAEPWVAAYVHLFEAQFHASRTHYATVLKYLLKPKRIRDQQADPRERVTIVANTHGTTGMEPLGIIRELDLARANHLLRDVAHHSKIQVRSQLENWRLRPRNHAELLALCVTGD